MTGSEGKKSFPSKSASSKGASSMQSKKKWKTEPTSMNERGDPKSKRTKDNDTVVKTCSRNFSDFTRREDSYPNRHTAELCKKDQATRKCKTAAKDMAKGKKKMGKKSFTSEIE
ncbi:Uncharacterized protein TCM_026528 [Theobroma cacao]|uniref:Uncharacterized protein n=1 Tax=Theobroma cacao TaxID=3641 RepID=A0A061F3P8_THECC|nr:Uncharacterized protein TCM_026528 [Theobroma cacao]